MTLGTRGRELGWTLLAIAGYGILIDLAVETFVAPLALRWWIAAFVIAWVGIGAMARWTWETRAVWTAVLLLGAFAFDAWTAAGLQLLGLRAELLHPMAVVVGMVLSAIAFRQMESVPLAVRWGGIAIATAAAVAFVAFRQAIPALVTILASTIATVLRLAVPALRKTSVEKTLRQSVALTTSFAIVLGTTPQGQAQRSTPRSTEQRVNELEEGLRTIEQSETSLPRDRWDLDFVVERAGKDPEDLYAWVQANTFWIPYGGVLRGPAGVLMDSFGNSVDRSLLLAALLSKAGHDVRLAHGEMDESKAYGKLPALVAVREAGSVDEPAAAATDTPAAPEAWQAQREAIERVVAELNQRVPEQTRRIHAAVATHARPPSIDERVQAEIKMLRDHWWVELQRDGAWTALDPLASRAGEALAAPRETMSQEEAGASIPRHTVTIRVIAEQCCEPAATEKAVLEHTLTPSQLIGTPITLQFWPTDQRTDDSSVQSLRAAALNQHRWTVALLVGREVEATTILREQGDVAEDQKGGAMGGLGSALANRLSQPNKPEGKGQTTLSAVWIEYEVRVPGRESHTIRRTVFDLVGPAARGAERPFLGEINEERKVARSFALMMRTEILPVVCQIAPEFLAHLSNQALLANEKLLRALVLGQVEPGSPATEELIDVAAPLPSPLYSLAMARFEWNRFGSRTFINEPGILTRHSYPAERKGRTVLVDATDIVANQVGVSLAEPDPFAVRLEQGIIDTNLEALLQMRPVVFGSAAEAFARGGPWVFVASKDDVALQRLKLPADTRARIVGDLKAGYMVFAPESPVPGKREAFDGWWRVDPATGNALGIGGNGWGSSAAEDASVKRSVAVEAAKRFFKAFVFEMFMCFGQVIQEEVEFGPKPPSEYSPAAQCAAQAVFWGIVAATVPLLFLSWEGPRVAGTLSEGGPKPKVPRRPKPPVPGKPSAKGDPPCPEGPEVSPRAESLPPGELPAGSAPKPKYGPTEVPRPGDLRPRDPGQLQRRVEQATAEREAAARWESQAATKQLAARERYEKANHKYEEIQNRRENDQFNEEIIAEQRKVSEQELGPAERDLWEAEKVLKNANREHRRAVNSEEYWKQITAANQRLLDAHNEQQAAERAFLDKQPVRYNGPEWDRLNAAKQRLRKAEADYLDVYWGAKIRITPQGGVCGGDPGMGETEGAADPLGRTEAGPGSAGPGTPGGAKKDSAADPLGRTEAGPGSAGPGKPGEGLLGSATGAAKAGGALVSPKATTSR